MNFIRKYLNQFVVVISLLTVISGLIQLIIPAFVLDFIGAEVTSLSSHLFAIVGMFMALFGGLMLHTVYSPRSSKEAILWSALQKLGAFVAVTLGVIKSLFAFVAIGVALFDLFSGILFLYYLKTRGER